MNVLKTSRQVDIHTRITHVWEKVKRKTMCECVRGTLIWQRQLRTPSNFCIVAFLAKSTPVIKPVEINGKLFPTRSNTHMCYKHSGTEQKYMLYSLSNLRAWLTSGELLLIYISCNNQYIYSASHKLSSPHHHSM